MVFTQFLQAHPIFGHLGAACWTCPGIVAKCGNSLSCGIKMLTANQSRWHISEAAKRHANDKRIQWEFMAFLAFIIRHRTSDKNEQNSRFNHHKTRFYPPKSP